MDYKMVSLIPARGGSERVERKNIKMMAGKPMLVWTIEASLQSKYINKTIVSTEDKEIKNIALDNGAEVLDRPQKYATDEKGYELSGIIQQLREKLKDENYICDYLCFLYPTCPLRTFEQINGTFELMLKYQSSMGRTAIIWQPQLVEEFFELDDYSNLYRPHRITMEDRYKLIRELPIHKDRYLPTDNVIIQPLRSFNVYHDIIVRDMVFYIIPKETWVDVNNEYDFERAQDILEGRKNKM